MIKAKFETGVRSNLKKNLVTDLAVVGGGIAGVCAAITAARQGVKVILVQDRPVLGGNASSEVRLWILGATSHMGNNNRWAREGGVIDEILVENLYKNKEGNPVVFDSILLDLVTSEPNITLLLNTSVFDLQKETDSKIKSFSAFCSQNSTEYEIEAELFCDASGDGIVSFMAGAPFRMGAESKEEFGELFAPDSSYGQLLGHSIYFYSKDTGRPVKYTPPEFALKDIKQIPRYKIISDKDYGCRLWWLEYGGRKDTIHESEDIKWELWKVVYGVWDYIKNSGEYPEAENLTLEWVGTVPGKRESRRFEGQYMMKQQDVVDQKKHDDAVAFGGWAMDLHPADGVYSELPGCTQWHSKGIYQIPFRAMFGSSLENLFYAGRIISSSHVAFGSTRVMATCGHSAQAVGMAASFCLKQNILPEDLLEDNTMRQLQNELNIAGQSIPGIPINQDANLANTAKIETSSTLALKEIPFDGDWIPLSTSVAQLVPYKKNDINGIRILVEASEPTQLVAELRVSKNPENYTPEICIDRNEVQLGQGEQFVSFEFNKSIEEDQYVFITFLKNDVVKLKGSQSRYTGILTVHNGENKAVSNTGKQVPPKGIGVDEFEFWIPMRRPNGINIAMEFKNQLDVYTPLNLVNGYTRPAIRTNAWSAALSDKNPQITFNWDKNTQVNEIILYFDTDYDHPMESSLMGHPESVIPFCVRNFRIETAEGQEIASVRDNYQTIFRHKLQTPLETNSIIVSLEHPSPAFAATIFQVVVR